MVAAVQAVGHAAHYDYGHNRHVIHAVGPDLRGDHKHEPSWAEGVAALGASYRNVLDVFARTGLTRLRLLPISGGNFAGRLGAEPGRMAELTKQALCWAHSRLDPTAQHKCIQANISMCIFFETEYPAFRDIFR